MPKLSQEVVATTTHEVSLKPAIKTKLVNKATAYQNLKTERDAIDEQMKGIRTEVEDILNDVGEASLKVDGHKLTIIAPVRRKLDPKLLVKYGVSTKIIAKATTETSGKPYVKITGPGERDDE